MKRQYTDKSRAGVNFIFAELEAGRTCSELAQLSDCAHLPKYLRLARMAYDNVIRYMLQAEFRGKEFALVTANAQHLKVTLEALEKPLAKGTAFVKFMNTELDTLRTFCELTEQGSGVNPARVPEYLENARKAYERVIRYMLKTTLQGKEFDSITAETERLKFRLEALEKRYARHSRPTG